MTGLNGINGEIPIDYLPILTWPKFFYGQQKNFVMSTAWQSWFIAGNGTGKSLLIYTNFVLHLLGLHPLQLAKPPIKIKCLVPSFDYVADVALEKLQSPQNIVFTELSESQLAWVQMLDNVKALKSIVEPSDGAPGRIEVRSHKRIFFHYRI